MFRSSQQPIGILVLALAALAVAISPAAPAAAQSATGLERIEAHATNRPLPSLERAAAAARVQAFRPGPARDAPPRRETPGDRTRRP